MIAGAEKAPSDEGAGCEADWGRENYPSLRASQDSPLPAPTVIARTPSEAEGDVAISSMQYRFGDCQEVNCPNGAREATLGCTSVRYSSQ